MLHKQFDIDRVCHTSMIWKVKRNYEKRRDWDRLVGYTSCFLEPSLKCSIWLQDIHITRVSDELVQSDCLAVIHSKDTKSKNFVIMYKGGAGINV